MWMVAAYRRTHRPSRMAARVCIHQMNRVNLPYLDDNNKHIIIIIIIFPRHMQTSTRMPSLEVEPTILVF